MDEPGSFRDPSGHIFWRDVVCYRAVNPSYREHFDRLLSSGLHDELTTAGLLIGHEEAGDDERRTFAAHAYRLLRPRLIDFISYPYEWCPGQLRAAALLVLDVQRRALARGLTLKDASAFNVQFADCRPVLIDTLSFEILRPGQPWVAYRQFCQHFLAPLALMTHVDVRLGELWRSRLDGIPLDLASTLLPWRTRLRPGLGLHVHAHARSIARHAGAPAPAAAANATPAPAGATAAAPAAPRAFSERAFRGLIDSLERAVLALTWEPGSSEWSGYYTVQHNYGARGLAEKERVIERMVAAASPRIVWDLGANTGVFSRLAAAAGARVIAFDVDAAVVERHWRQLTDAGDGRVLPLIMDFSNPTPALGWAHEERRSLAARGPANLLLALGLVHHLAIGNNVPLRRIAEWLASLGDQLIIEFVPRSDSQVVRMLASREDVFTEYHETGFESAFAAHWRVEERTAIAGTDRLLYRLRRQSGSE